MWVCSSAFVCELSSKFMPHLSDVWESLRPLIDKDIEWTWLPQHGAAVGTIKQLKSHCSVMPVRQALRKENLNAFASRTLICTD